MRQFVSISLLMGLLMGCSHNVSGRFVGEYVEQLDIKRPMIYIITDEGDHYKIKVENFRDAMSKKGEIKYYIAEEIDQHTIKTQQGRMITLSDDGRILQPVGLTHTLIRVEQPL